MTSMRKAGPRVRRSRPADPKRRMAVGDQRRLMLPWSEVCLHMGVADQVWLVELREHGMAQLMYDDGHPFSLPITAGEAGIYRDERGHYTY